MPYRAASNLPLRDSFQSQKTRLNATVSAALLLALLFSTSASAIDAGGGVRFDDKISSGGGDLIANGAGVRTKVVFDVYAIALYLPIRATTPEAVAAQSGARRIAVQLLRDVSAGDFVDALKSGLQENLSATEFGALKAQIQQFADTLTAVKEVRKGTPVLIDYLPASGTRISVSGQVRGADIAGPAFFDGLLKIWLGSKPVQADLKAKLLGK